MTAARVRENGSFSGSKTLDCKIVSNKVTKRQHSWRLSFLEKLTDTYLANKGTELVYLTMLSNNKVIYLP